VRQALGAYQAPEAREGLRAQRELEARNQRDAEAAEAQRGQVINSFWGKVQADIAAALPQHEYLSDEDVAEVQDRFYRGYEAHRNTLVDRYSQIAAQRGIPVEHAVAEAERDALAWLTEQNLAATMKGLNDRYAARAGRKGGTPTRTPAPKQPDPTTARTDADKHNRHVDNKLRQRTTGRVLRGNNGAPPAGNPARPARASTYKGQMDAMFAELHKAAQRKA
jgi:hypothetical protein